MPSSLPRRAAPAIALAAIVVGVLSGCDPVALARTPLEARATASPSATPTTRVAASLCDAPASTETAVPTVGYASLDRGAGFTASAARASGRVVTLGATTLRLGDFVPAAGTLDAGVLGPAARGLIGSGAATTTVEVAPHVSTRAAAIPTTFPETNQLDVLRVTGRADVLRGLTVRGTDQGHLYNGLRVDRVRGLRASDLRVVGVPGDDSQPPGETFGINDYRTVGSAWSHVEVDGAGVGASGFGVNGSSDIHICDTVSKGNRSAMGFAFWQSSGITLIDCVAADNGFSGFNFERVSGRNTLIRPSATGNRYGMRIASDRSSARFTIVDPQLTDGHWTVTLPRRWYGVANRQRASDISVIVDGRDRPDLLRIVRS